MPFHDETLHLLYPLKDGILNLDEYTSVEELCGDLATIWRHSIEEELKIPLKDFGEYRVVLIVPDLFPRQAIQHVFLEVLLRHCGFRAALIQTESVCACFGAGLSSATVVHVGEVTTQVSCVDDGVVLPISRINLKYGLEDVRRYMFYQLYQHGLPFREMARLTPWHQRWMKELARSLLSLSEVLLP